MKSPRLWLSTLIIALAGACSYGPTDSQDLTHVPASLQLPATTVEMTAGDQLQLLVLALNANGELLETADLKYSSSDENVVDVDTTGLLTALTEGSATIEVEAGPVTGTIDVTVLAGETPPSPPPPPPPPPVADRLMFGPGRPFAVAAHCNTHLYASSLDGFVIQIDPDTRTEIARIQVGGLTSSMVFSHDGSRLYVGGQSDGVVTVIDVATNTIVGRVQLEGGVFGMAPVDGDSLLLVAADYKLYVVHTASLTVTGQVQTGMLGNTVVTRGSSVWLNDPFGGAIKEYDWSTLQLVRALSVGGKPQGMVLSSNGTKIYLANEIGEFQVWDLATGARQSIMLPGGGGFGLARHPTTGQFYVSTSYLGTGMHTIDSDATHIVATRDIGVGRRIAFLEDGRLGIVASESGWVDFIR